MALTPDTPSPALALFTANAERAASIVHGCDGIGDVVDLVRRHAGEGSVSVSETLADRHPELVERLEASFRVIRPGTPERAAEAAVGVSAGEALVVETGSVLVAEHPLGDRLVSMLSPILVQVVRAESVLPSLDDVGELLAARHRGGVGGYQALITGPSRSADIERSLTIGVQGPSEVHVAILFGSSAEAPL